MICTTISLELVSHHYYVIVVYHMICTTISLELVSHHYYVIVVYRTIYTSHHCCVLVVYHIRENTGGINLAMYGEACGVSIP